MLATYALGERTFGEQNSQVAPAPLSAMPDSTFGASSFGESSFGDSGSGLTTAGVAPAAAILAFTGYAPTLMQMSGLFPSAATVALNGQIPSIGQGRSVSPSAASPVFYGSVPSIGQGQSPAPSAAAIFISGPAPLIIQGNTTELKPVSIAQFRLDYPEFADTTKFTDAQIGRQLRAATNVLSEATWFECWPDGIELRTAHFLTIGARNASAAAAGGAGGAVLGLLTSKSVDKVAAGYDVGTTTYEGAGFWNTTAYGIEFYQLLMMFGAGPIQL